MKLYHVRFGLVSLHRSGYVISIVL